MKADICGSETLAEISAARGHPGLNRGPLDLQSNALPLSYIPLREKVYLPLVALFLFLRVN